MIVAFTIRLIFIFALSFADYAYYFPYAWTAEFSLGIIVGDRIRRGGGLKPPSRKYQNIIISAGSRVWPVYLVHMAAIVFMPVGAPIKDFFLTVLVFLILTEIFYRVLNFLNDKLRLIKKEKPPP